MPRHQTTPGLPLSLSAKAKRTDEQPISSLVSAAIGSPDLISFAAGLVDPATLPIEETLRITQKILSNPARARQALQYDTTAGLKPLRERMLAHLESLEGIPARKMGLTPDHLLVTTGSQQALYILGDVLLDPGDVVIAANPSYFVYTGTLASLGAKVLTVPMDDNGMVVEQIPAILDHLESTSQLHRLKFIYCTSFYQNPTGLTLSLERRHKLLDIVKKYSRSHRILILEDAAYRELRYEGAPLPSIKSLDHDNSHTILAQTFSKPFAPGLKTGYTAMPPDLLQEMLHQKGNHDFGSPHLCQQIVLEAMNDGSYSSHLQILINEYRRKRDLMLAALERHFPKNAAITWTRPQGGLYVWVTLPKSIDTSRDGITFEKCVQQGVMFVPGAYCFQPDAAGIVASHHLHLSFGQVAADQIDDGIARLARVVSELLVSHHSRTFQTS